MNLRHGRSTVVSNDAEWDRVVKRPQEVCVACDEVLQSGEEVVTLLAFGAEGFVRRDLHPECAAEDGGAVATWRWKRASELRPNAHRLDLGFLSEFFKRLDGRTEEHSRRVHWIVALLLLRKKILEETGRTSSEGCEVLHLRFKKTERVYDVLDPSLDSEAVSSIEGDLSRIFNLEQAVTGEMSDGESASEIVG